MTRIVQPEKPSRWSAPSGSAAWFGRARHDARLALDWDRRALSAATAAEGIPGRLGARKHVRAAELAVRGRECWVGAVVALLRALA